MKSALWVVAAICGVLGMSNSAQAQKPPLNQSDLYVSGTVQSIDYKADCRHLNIAGNDFASALAGASGGCSASQTTYVAITLTVVTSTDDVFKPGNAYMVNVVDPAAQDAMKNASGNPVGKMVRIYNMETGFCPDSDDHIMANDTGSWLCTQ
jgi:hypothetical protein